MYVALRQAQADTIGGFLTFSVHWFPALRSLSSLW